VIRLALAALALSASPAFAASYYHAVPAATPIGAKIVARDIVWNCGARGCSAGQSGSRPAIVCAVLAREVGELRSFAVQGRPLGSDELAKCNARAG
jgi:hypothetical protein